jgi:hypothetical protein
MEKYTFSVRKPRSWTLTALVQIGWSHLLNPQATTTTSIL